MLFQFVLGIGLIAFSVAICTACIAGAIAALRRVEPRVYASRRPIMIVVILSVVTLWLLVGLLATIFLWAFAFIGLGLFETLEAAVYFSMVCITTVGFGDVILPDEWRLLSGLAAMDGFILFGLVTAFLFEVLRRFHEPAQHHAPLNDS